MIKRTSILLIAIGLSLGCSMLEKKTSSELINLNLNSSTNSGTSAQNPPNQSLLPQSSASPEGKTDTTTQSSTLVAADEAQPNGAGSEGIPNPLPEVKPYHNDDIQKQEKLVVEELEKIPADMGDAVEKWISYFQGRGRVYMERYLARSTRHMGLMTNILREQGLPEDLVYVALIESGFSSRVTSRAGAVGYWQFIRATGRRYGLEINQFVDERRDPVRSTYAAAKYLKDLYEDFGSWQLAMASYNVGEGRIKREMNRHLTNDFWELAKKKRIPRETREYIPKFFAAKLIATNPEVYGFSDVEYQPPGEFDVVRVEKNINLRKLAEALNITYEEIKTLNPKYRGEIAPANKGSHELRVPVGTAEAALAATEKSVVDKVVFVADQGETLLHRIRAGDTLSTIARRYRVSIAEIRDLNQLGRKNILRVGARILVPDRGIDNSIASMKNKAVAQAEKQSQASSRADAQGSNLLDNRIQKMVAPDITTSITASVAASVAGSVKKAPIADSNTSVHVVKAGDNLTTIARKYRVTIDSLRKVNSLSRRSVLRVGLKLKIPDSQG